MKTTMMSKTSRRQFCQMKQRLPRHRRNHLMSKVIRTKIIQGTQLPEGVTFSMPKT